MRPDPPLPYLTAAGGRKGPVMPNGTTALTTVFGGGGVVGIAYNMGVATGLVAAGIPVAAHPMLGTSAGSWTASALALGVPWEQLQQVPTPAVPCVRPGQLLRLARSIFAEAQHPLVSASVVSVRNGRRRILSGADHRLADLVAASSAVPGLFLPHRVAGDWCVDGGVRSMTSAHLAPAAAHLIVVAPLTGPVLGPGGAALGLVTGLEVLRWRQKNPGARTTLVSPAGDVARIVGLNPLRLFDADLADAVFPLAYAQGLRVGRSIVHASQRSAA